MGHKKKSTTTTTTYRMQAVLHEGRFCLCPYFYVMLCYVTL